MSFYTVYRTTNLLDGKTYIGKHKTDNPNDDYLGSGILINRAIKKHGRDNFQKEILFIFATEAEANAKEKEIVVIDETTYNLCEGGQGGYGYINRNGFTNKDKDYSKVSKALKGRKKPWLAEFNRKQRNLGTHDPFIEAGKVSMLGKHHSEETKRAISLANSIMRGPKNSQFGTCWITKDSVNKKCNKSELETFLNKGWSKGRKM